VYLSFVAEDGPSRRILRVVRAREAGEALGEPATLFETPLLVAADGSGGGPRMAFGPDRLLHVLLPTGIAFDDPHVAGQPDAAMTRLDDEGRVAGTGFAGGPAHPLGFGWHPMTSALWGLVPRLEGDVIVRSMDDGFVPGLRELWSGPRFAVAASQPDRALVFRPDAAVSWTTGLARAFHPADSGTIRLAVPVLIDGLVEGLTGRIVDVVGKDDVLYVAVEGFRTPADPAAEPTAVILKLRESSR
jgi:hypothetical protein